MKYLSSFFGALLVLLPGGLTVAAAVPAATIEGQIFDRDAVPLAGVTLRVLTQRSTALDRLTGQPSDAREVARGVTDDQGFFRIVVDDPPAHTRLWVLCDAKAGWDRVRYALPEPRDVARRLRRDGHAVLALAVEDAPGWPDVAHEIKRSGGVRSPRGSVLRRYGLPPEMVTQIDGREQWRYPEVTFVFDRERLVETHPAEVARADSRTAQP
ncbi:MAG: hypothetical protein JSV80_14695 [Acidobacteriota bacterium]|nr:MAG: hypothetical protein JSV80_14695 [Acidobacteriota bacterium]